ncbi:hypothetical protein ACWDRB_18775 [Nonomuraea sp. NPDC003707]
MGEITERAMASRVAFYRNCRGKYHLMEQIFDEAIAALLGSMGDDGERPSIEHWAAFFEYVAEYQPLCGALFGKKRRPVVRGEEAVLALEHGRPARGPAPHIERPGLDAGRRDLRTGDHVVAGERVADVTVRDRHAGGAISPPP